MTKEKRILIYFISFLLGLFTSLYINIIKVKADTVIAPVKYVTSDTTLYISNNKGADIQLNSTVQNSNNIDIKKILMNINYSFKANVIYQIELSTPTQYLINVNNVSILSSDNTCSFKQITDANIGFPKIRFTCPYDTSYVTIGLSNLSDNNITSSYNFRWNYTYLSIVNENVVDLNPVLDGQAGINNNITNSTNTITGSITDTENNITNSITDTENNINQNIDDMESAIIDSNKETQDVIKDQFNDCRQSINLFNAKLIPSSTGIVVNDDGSKITMPVISSGNGVIYTQKRLKELAPNIKVGDTIYLAFTRKPNNDYNTFIYLSISDIIWDSDSYKVITEDMLNGYVSLYANRFSSGETSQITLENFRMILGTSNKPFEPFGEICNNKIDETNDKLDGIQGALTDSSAPNISGLENSAGWLPAGPLDSILNLPLTMLNSLTNSLGKTCAPLNLKLPYVNKNIQIPCLSAIFAQITGVNGLWTWVGTIASVLILYNYLLNLYAWVDRVLTLRAEFDEAMGADMANWGRL